MSKKRVEFHSAMVKNYRLSSPVTKATDLVSYINPTGEVDLYFADPEKNSLYKIIHDNETATVCSQIKIGEALRDLVIVNYKTRKQILYGINKTNHLTMVEYSTEKKEYVYTVIMPEHEITELTACVSNAMYDGSDTPNPTDVTFVVKFKNGQIGYNRLELIHKGYQSWIQHVAAPIGAKIVNGKNGGGYWLFIEHDATLKTDASSRGTFHRSVLPPLKVKYAVNHDRYIFAIGQDNALYYTRKYKDFLAWTKLNDHLPFKMVQAVTNHIGQVEVFALGLDGQIYHTALLQENHQAETFEFSTLFPIGVYAEEFSVSVDHTGFLDLYTISPDNKLHHLFRNPQTTTWSDEIIGLAGEKLDEFYSFQTEVKIFDEQEKPCLNKEVQIKIWSSNRTHLTVNGKMYACSSNEPIEFFNTNPQGALTIVEEVDSINASMLKIWTAFMEPNERVVVEPNVHIKEKLHAVSVQDLLTAKLTGEHSQEEFLVPVEFRNTGTLQEIVKGLQQTMAMVRPTPSFADAQPAISPGIYHVNHDTGDFPNRILTKKIPAQNWQLDLRSETPVFRQLSEEQAAAMILEDRGRLRAISSWSRLRTFFGNIWNAVKKGVATVTQVVVTTVKSAVQSAIRLVINGVEYLYELTMEFAEQAFQIAASILQKIKVPFQRFFQWLGEEMGWNDILKTHDLFIHCFDELIDYGIKSIDSLKQKVGKTITSYVGSVEAHFDHALRKVLKQDSLTNFHTTHTSPTSTHLQTTALYNPVVSIWRNYVSVQTPANDFPNHNMEDIIQERDSFLGILDEFITDMKSRNEFHTAMNFFRESMEEDPQKFLTYSLAGVLEVLKGISVIAMKGINRLLDALFLALKKFLEKLREFAKGEWNIPILKQLYYKLTGRTLSPLSAVSLLLAVPSTISYKLIFGTNIPTDSINEVKAKFNSNALTALTQDSPSTSLEFSLPLGNVSQNVLKCIMIGFGFVAGYVLEPILDTLPGTPMGLGIAVVSVSVLFNALGSLPFAYDTTERLSSSWGGCLIGQWMFRSFFMPIADFASLSITNAVPGASMPKLLKQHDVFVWGSAFLGAVDLALGAVYIGLSYAKDNQKSIQKNIYADIALLLDSVVKIAKPVRLFKVNGAPVGLALLVVIDFLSSFSTTGLRITDVIVTNK